MTAKIKEDWTRELNEDPDVPFGVTLHSGPNGPFDVALFARFDDGRKGFEYSEFFDVDSPVTALRLMLESIRDEGCYSLDTIAELSIMPVMRFECDDCDMTTTVANTGDSNPLALLWNQGWHARSTRDSGVTKCPIHKPSKRS